MSLRRSAKGQGQSSPKLGLTRYRRVVSEGHPIEECRTHTHQPWGTSSGVEVMTRSVKAIHNSMRSYDIHCGPKEDPKRKMEINTSVALRRPKGTCTNLTPFPRNSSPSATPLALINLRLKVDAVLIPVGNPVPPFVARNLMEIIIQMIGVL